MQQFDTIASLKNHLTISRVEEIAVQSLDLTELEPLMLSIRFSGCLFLGCKMSDALLHHLLPDNFIFPILDVPFNTYPNRLYDKDTLYNGFDYHHPETYFQTKDKIVYDYYQKSLETLSIKDTLAQRLHDHSITDSLYEYISRFDERKLVAIMGGHNMKRTELQYAQVARLSKSLTESGYLMLSGGGPGAMEATHAGAWMAGRTDDELREALDIIREAPSYADENWLSSAFKMMERFPHPAFDSLGIPTWHYGHELPTPFATRIAKYFENSVREEGLLAIAKGGVIFTPGSAGTIQEVFQDLAQNHYESYGYASPMIFLNVEFWTKDRPIFPIIQLMSERGDLHNLNLGLYDENEKVIEHLARFSE